MVHRVSVPMAMRWFVAVVVVVVMGIQCASARAVPYTDSEHSPFEGLEMKDIERLRLEGRSEVCTVLHRALLWCAGLVLYRLWLCVVAFC